MAISGKRIILANDQALRAKDQSGNVVELLKINASGALAGQVADELADKALASDVTTLQSKMDTAESEIDQLQSDVNNKAAQSDLTVLDGRVTSAEGNIITLQSDVSGKASQVDMTQAQSDIDALELSMAAKASQSDLDDLDGYAQDIRFDHDALEVRVGTAEGEIDTLQSEMDAVELSVAAKLDASQKGAANGVAELDAAGKVPASQLPSISSVAAVKMSPITLTAQQVTDGYLDLSHEALSGSIHVFCERVAILESLDYSVSSVGGVSRLTWIGPSAAGAEEEFSAGDVVYIQYLRSL